MEEISPKILPVRYKSVGGFAIGTLFSRILGLAREGVIAYLLGASRYSDALYVAFRIPNLLRDILAEGSVQTAFVPTYVKVRELKERPGAFLSAVMIYTLLLGVSLVILGIFLAPLIVRIFAFGFTKDPQKFQLTVNLSRVTFPFLLAVSFAALLGGILNAFRRFFVPALSPVFFNLGIIALGTVAITTRANFVKSAVLLAVGIVIGGVLQAVFHLPFLLRIGKREVLLQRPEMKHPYLKSLIKLTTPVVLSTALTRFTLFVNTLIASFMRHGAISYLNYAYRIMHLPIGLFGVGVATVILPDLTALSARGKQLVKELRRGVDLTLFLTVPMSIFIAFHSTLIIKILFERGTFDPVATSSTARALLFYTIGIPFFSTSRILLNYFYAQHRVKIPNLVFFLGTATNLIFALTLAPFLDFPALALSTSIAGFVQVISLFLLIKKELGETVVSSSFLNKTIIAFILLALIFEAILRFFGVDLPALFINTFILLTFYILGMGVSVRKQRLQR
jgi:putative peptidoglycan lipid II flippase